MADVVYTPGIRRLIDNGWTSQDVRVLLLDDAGSYVPDKDHATLAALSLGANELDTPNYVRPTLSALAEITDLGDNDVSLDSNDSTWTSLGPSAGGPTIQAAVVYFHVTNDADSVPFLYLDSGFPKTVNGDDLTLQWHVGGLVSVAQP